MVATPHTLNGVYTNDRATILNRVHELNQALIECGMQNAEFGMGNKEGIECGMQNAEFGMGNKEGIECGMRNAECGMENYPSSTKDAFSSAICNLQSAMEGSGSSSHSEFRIPNSAISFKVLPGADVSFSPDIMKRFEKGEVETLNDKGRSILVEFPSQGIPYRAEEVLFQLMVKGVVPIISHPERNLEIARRPGRYYEMIRMGCLGQVTAMSLTGGFGSGVRRVAEKLLASRLVHMIASDAHSVDRRPPILSAAVKAAGKILGAEEAAKMVTDYPEAILNGRRPRVADPRPIDKW
jgi:protein-tyrosine phosphatase